MKNVALLGNPNVGKTTLFNSLTGSNQRVGNWAGVTVDKKEGFFDDFKIVDSQSPRGQRKSTIVNIIMPAGIILPDRGNSCISYRYRKDKDHYVPPSVPRARVPVYGVPGLPVESGHPSVRHASCSYPCVSPRPVSHLPEPRTESVLS